MYCFQESEPLSRPPPVSFSPPNAPPISAPEGPILTFTIPVSAPRGPVHCNKKIYVKIMYKHVIVCDGYLEEVLEVLREERSGETLRN